MRRLQDWLNWWFRFFTQIAVWPRDLPVLVKGFQHRKRWNLPVEIWTQVDAVPGFMSERECALLYRAARYWPLAGPLIELGSYQGRSTILQALAGRQVHAVDAWSPATHTPTAIGPFTAADDQTLQAFRDHIRQAGVEDRISAHRGLTTEVAQGWQTECAILFVDAGHHYPAVRADLDAWLPHLSPDGLLLLHDTFSDRFKGVIQAAGELLQAGWVIVVSSGTIVGLTRRATAERMVPGNFGETA